MANLVASSQYSINGTDFWRGMLMAVLTPIVFIIASSVNAGSLVFDWHGILIAGISGGLAYLIKNFFTPTAITVVDPSKASVDAVKEGTAEIRVVKSP